MVFMHIAVVRPVTSPMPSIESDVALLTVHERVDERPVGIVAGCAVNLEITGGRITVTVAVALLVPPSPIAVSV